MLLAFNTLSLLVWYKNLNQIIRQIKWMISDSNRILICTARIIKLVCVCIRRALFHLADVALSIEEQMLKHSITHRLY